MYVAWERDGRSQYHRAWLSPVYRWRRGSEKGRKGKEKSLSNATFDTWELCGMYHIVLEYRYANNSSDLISSFIPLCTRLHSTSTVPVHKTTPLDKYGTLAFNCSKPLQSSSLPPTSRECHTVSSFFILSQKAESKSRCRHPSPSAPRT